MKLHFPQRFVYFAQCPKTGHIKIGVTNNLYQRLNAHRTERGFLPLAFMLGDREKETELHRQFKYLRTTQYGEIYRPGAEILTFVKHKTISLERLSHNMTLTYLSKEDTRERLRLRQIYDTRLKWANKLVWPVLS